MPGNISHEATTRFGNILREAMRHRFLDGPGESLSPRLDSSFDDLPARSNPGSIVALGARNLVFVHEKAW
jgi:hypothetical protein